MKFPTALSVCLVASVFMCTFGCGGSDGAGDPEPSDGDGSGGPTGPPPQLVTVLPDDGTSGHERSALVSVEFDIAMNPSTVTVQSVSGPCEGTIQLSSDNFVSCRGGIVDGSQNPIFTMDPAGFLNDDTVYKIKVTTQASSAGGMALEADFVQASGFGTGNAGPVQAGPPKVEAVTAETNSLGVIQLDAAFQIEFSKPMELDSFDPSGASCDGNILLSADNFASCIPLSLDVITSESQNPIIVFLPDVKLRAGTSYRISVGDSVFSADGVALGGEFLSAQMTTCGILSNGTQCGFDLSENAVPIAGADLDQWPKQDGPLASATFFNLCVGMAIDDLLYVRQVNGYHNLRLVNFATNSVSTITGDVGTLSGDFPTAGTTEDIGDARFNFGGSIGAITYNYVDDIVYITDPSNNKIRAFNRTNSTVTTLTGDGTNGYIDAAGTAARFSTPVGLTYVRRKNKSRLYILDTGNNMIRQMDLATQMVSTVAGLGGGIPTNACSTLPLSTCDGIGNDASLRTSGTPVKSMGMVYDGRDYIYFADGAGVGWAALRRMHLDTFEIETLQEGSTIFDNDVPVQMAIAGDIIFIGIIGSARILQYNIANNVVSVPVGNGTSRPTYGTLLPPPASRTSSSLRSSPICVATSPNGLYISDHQRVLIQVPAL